MITTYFTRQILLNICSIRAIIYKTNIYKNAVVKYYFRPYDSLLYNYIKQGKQPFTDPQEKNKKDSIVKIKQKFTHLMDTNLF